VIRRLPLVAVVAGSPSPSRAAVEPKARRRLPRPAPTSPVGAPSSIADDARFKDALAAADLPGETTGFVYLNPAELVPLLADLEVAQPGGNIRKEIRENSRPLQSLLVYATQGRRHVEAERLPAYPLSRRHE
jgi:hypothetical protein